MSDYMELDRARHQAALRDWLEDCRQRWVNRFPLVPFESNDWHDLKIHEYSQANGRLRPALADFIGKDRSFTDGVRCIAAELVLSETTKSLDMALRGFRFLATNEVQTLFDLRLVDLHRIEANRLKHAEANPEAVGSVLADLQNLSRQVDMLGTKGVIPRVVYVVSRSIKARLYRVSKLHRESVRFDKVSTLDRKIEALSEATTALFNFDSRLSSTDRVAIAAMNLEMCAPSRVNEILCLATDDYVVLDDYVGKSDGLEQDKLRSIHQMLIISMKGSKGAQWGAKPVLKFMMELFNMSLAIILEHGARSRKLVSWYQQNPTTLYLPPELEYLRGKDVDRHSLWKIVNLTDDRVVLRPSSAANVNPIFRELSENGKLKKMANPRMAVRDGKIISRRPVQSVSWADLEKCLLGRVQKAMEVCRRVTTYNYYEGDLSKMLFLFDTNETPYLPGSLKYKSLRGRLKISDGEAAYLKKSRVNQWEPTLFEKLGITMPVNGKVQIAWIDTHDPRRWLTTTALSAREKLPDVLINKWARRLSIDQLKHYDLRTAEQKADQSSMPAVLELEDLSKGIESARAQEEQFGLRTEIVTVHDAGISVTSMDAIAAAVEQRPIARTSEQLFIIYPSWFGACIHQHHETPCRAYSASCLPCDNNLVVKGHLPTNEAVRARERLLHGSIVEQLEKLVMAQNRGVADNPASLDEHLLTLAKHGLNPQQMADDIIARFHEVKHLIKDVCFANKLEEAFVATGMVVRLDDPKVASGALIKYHNPTRHAAPGGERAWDAHGGREGLEKAREHLIHMHPMFAPTAEGLSDQRSLMEPDDDEESVESSYEAERRVSYE